jgi:hypothetical protein
MDAGYRIRIWILDPNHLETLDLDLNIKNVSATLESILRLKMVITKATTVFEIV